MTDPLEAASVGVNLLGRFGAWFFLELRVAKAVTKSLAAQGVVIDQRQLRISTYGRGFFSRLLRSDAATVSEIDELLTGTIRTSELSPDESLSRLRRELVTAYGARARGQSPALAFMEERSAALHEALATELGLGEAAETSALAAYRRRLSSVMNVLDISAVLPEIPSINIEDALSGWRVEWVRDAGGSQKHEMSRQIWQVVRRNSRFVVTGLPGMGKSEAMRQISARLASDPTAPIPIHVDLRDVVREVQVPADLTLDLLIQRPSRMAADASPSTLVRVLRRAVASGNAIFVVDGLDEALAMRGTVSAGLAQLLTELPASVGLIVSTRNSALDAASALAIPIVRLKPPVNLRDSLDGLLDRYAAVHVAAAGRGSWLAERRAQVHAGLSEADDFWTVPLLATLATLRIARNRDPASSTIELLNGVIDDSVVDWELRKAAGRSELDPEMRPEILLQGFAALGHLLNQSGSATLDEARVALADVLEPWDLSVPIQYRLVTQVLDFWDERVGVFLIVGELISPRSRQFAELGDVRWIAQKKKSQRRRWLVEALGDPDRANAVSLAAASDPAVRSELIRRAARGGDAELRRRAATWLARMWPAWTADTRLAGQIISVLADAAEDQMMATNDNDGIIRSVEASRLSRDGGGWEFVLGLVLANLDADTAALRDSRIAALGLTVERGVLVDAIRALTSAQHERRPLLAAEVVAVASILTSPAPARGESRRREDGVLAIETGESFVSGVDRVVEMSLDFLEQLPSSAPDAMFRLSKSLPMRTYEKVTDGLVALGHVDPDPTDFTRFVPSEWLEQREDVGGLGWLLRRVDALFPIDSPTNANEAWRMKELGDLLDRIEWGESSVQGFVAAAKEPTELIDAWLAAVVEAHSLEGGLIGRHARVLLRGQYEDELDALQFGRLSLNPDPAELQVATAVQLVQAFRSGSEWIVDQVAGLLVNAKQPAIADAIWAIEGALRWRSLFLATAVGLANELDPIQQVQRNAAGNSARRAAVALYARQDPRFLAELETLRLDRDATVRGYSGGTASEAEVWTCIWCAHENRMTLKSCERCNLGSTWKDTVRDAE